jgi:aminoglycoside phosphotransferase (APT) family kinase protein
MLMRRTDLFLFESFFGRDIFRAKVGDPGARRWVTAVTAKPGFPSRAELASRYAEQRGASLEAIRWYEAFGVWRLAVILQQIYIRFARGQTADPRFAHFGKTAAGLLDAAAALLGVPIG